MYIVASFCSSELYFLPSRLLLPAQQCQSPNSHFEIQHSAIITSRQVIIAKYDAILDQSERVHLDNHLSKDTDLNRQGKKTSSSDDMRERFFSRCLKFRGKSTLDKVSLDIPRNQHQNQIRTRSCGVDYECGSFITIVHNFLVS